MRQSICINGISAEMLQHSAYNAFAGGDIAGQTDDIFSGYAAQSRFLEGRIITILFYIKKACD